MQGLARATEPGSDDRLVTALARWKQGAGEALLVVDQAEELFTLNSEQSQVRFAALLGRAMAEAGVSVLLSLRDDFLFRCHSRGPLGPVFHDLTPLGPPSPDALRRALVEPAAGLGVRFEDEALVAEMVGSVEKERGALPLLAFAVSRLWEERDRERRILTRDAHARIGGVAGALAQHAEATLQRVGAAREGVVREILRNLVTAEGTRAAREREQLLSVFAPEPAARAEGETVLNALVTSRLLTEYEADDAAPSADGGRPRIEIVHESLLTHWPRLQRWLAQDAEGALLRDQLRQAARLWDQKARPDELLWTGPAHRKYAVWRERYSGGLSTLEEDFARAMDAHAGRRRRRRRIAVATVLATAVGVAAITAALWRRSESSRHRAEAEAGRAEASKLLALGQLELEADPTAALAYALKSLEVADTPAARVFALRVLQQGPIALVAPTLQEGAEAHELAFSPQGDRLAIGGYRKVQVWSRDGAAPVVLGDQPTRGMSAVIPAFGPGGDLLAATVPGEVAVYSLPEGKEVWRRRIERSEWSSGLFSRGERFFTATSAERENLVRAWSFAGDPAQLVGRMDVGKGEADIDPDGSSIAYPQDRRVLLRSLLNWALPVRVIGQSPDVVTRIRFHPRAKWIAALDRSGEVRLWPLGSGSKEPLRVLPAKNMFNGLAVGPAGESLMAYGNPDGQPRALVWDFTGPPDTEPLVLTHRRSPFFNGAAFDPAGDWVATAHVGHVAFWPMDRERSHVLRSPGDDAGPIDDLVFTPDGRSLVSAERGGTVRVWPLAENGGEHSRVVLRLPTSFINIDIDPTGRWIVASGTGGRVVLVPVAGGAPRELEGFSKASSIFMNAFDRRGRRVAAASYISPAHDKVIRVWDLESGSVQVLGPIDGAADGWADAFNGLAFLPDGRLVSCNAKTGLQLWDLQEAKPQTLFAGPKGPTPCWGLALGPEGRYVVHLSENELGSDLVWTDLEQRTSTTIPGFRAWNTIIALDPGGTLLATSDQEGVVWAGPVNNPEPHPLFGHKGAVRPVAISPDGRWVASGGEDRTVRVSPIPKGRAFHKLPYDELLSRLRAVTNVRVVADARVPSGYRLDESGPFPGWKTVARWRDP